MQAALQQIWGRNGRPLWPEPIDCKATRTALQSSEAAIASFQSKASLGISGTSPTNANAPNPLERVLSSSCKDLHDIPGISIVAGHVARKRLMPDGGGALWPFT
ncbi:MAG: hypothetical protein V1267_11115 [Alphaproteobacteria bacterium]|nr:hypothetical protein [Alphaproteobacteria bacterium]HJM61420.1 hypothetical protein [Alphaproteobacteria bacterium]